MSALILEKSDLVEDYRSVETNEVELSMFKSSCGLLVTNYYSSIIYVNGTEYKVLKVRDDTDVLYEDLINLFNFKCY